ncbi:MAG: four helix bundle protein [Chloroflexi bacterium]|nr:four helix bundle protein [Chloroflexota bacterium]
MFKFEKLEVWKKSVQLYQEVLESCEAIGPRDQGSLGEQLRRASLSVSANIAEGAGRDGVREARYFFNIGKGSVYEVVSLLYVLRQRGLLQPNEYDALYKQCDEIAMMLSGLMKR